MWITRGSHTHMYVCALYRYNLYMYIYIYMYVCMYVYTRAYFLKELRIPPAGPAAGPSPPARSSGAILGLDWGMPAG